MGQALRVIGAGSSQRLSVLVEREESTDDQWAEDAATSSFIESECLHGGLVAERRLLGEFDCTAEASRVKNRSISIVT
jgi:hypothetical protein